MNSNQLKGTLTEPAGNVQAGRITASEEQQPGGLQYPFTGTARHHFGNAGDIMRDARRAVATDSNNL